MRQPTPVLTIENYKDRGFRVERLICPNCKQVWEVSEEVMELDVNKCPSCRTPGTNHQQWKRMEQVKEIDTFTIQQWIKVLPWMIDINRRKQRPLITLFLVNKWQLLLEVCPVDESTEPTPFEFM